jgi:hypothetical protein
MNKKLIISLFELQYQLSIIAHDGRRSNLSIDATLMLYQELEVPNGQFKTQSMALPASE